MMSTNYLTIIIIICYNKNKKEEQQVVKDRIGNHIIPLTKKDQWR